MKRYQQDIITLLTATLFYGLLMIYHGYQYGVGDQSQILPCLFAQDHPEAYAGDHYVNAYLNSPVNERSVFHFFLRYLGYEQPWLVWLWHALMSVMMILAWMRIVALGITSKGLQWLALALIFIAGSHTNMGGNELYYPILIPSLAAKCLASWGLYFWLKERYSLWALLLILAGWMQPLVSIQLFLLTFLSLTFHLVAGKQLRQLPWKPAGLYLILTLPWIYLLTRYNGGHDDPAGFMDIMEFRLSHHFYPHSFGWFHLVFGGMLALVTLRFYRQRLKWFMVLIALGCLLYTIGVEVYRIPEVLYSQWWKTTIWLEAFAFIAITAQLEKVIQRPAFLIRSVIAMPLLLVLLVFSYRTFVPFQTRPIYLFPWSEKVTDEIDISRQAETLTPPDAIFIVPVDFTAFRWYAKRSQYVDYKAMLHQESFLKTWYKRMQEIYAFGLSEKKGGFNLHIFSQTLLDEPTTISRDAWKQKGITHIVSTNLDIPELQQVARNTTYAIYQL